MKGKWLLLTILSVLAASGCEQRPPERADAPGILAAAPVPKALRAHGPLGCSITGEPTCELGKDPKISVTLTNRTGADIYLVRSLDASCRKDRYPHCTFAVTGPDGKPAHGFGAFCGNMNTLRVGDFVKVPAGGAFNPYGYEGSDGFAHAYQIFHRTFREPGEYRIRFTYSTKSDDIREWAGDGKETVFGDTRIADLFRQVPRIEVSSDEFILTVVAPGK